MTYSQLSDIEDRLPFAVSDRTRPSSTQLTGFQEQANWVINDYIGVSTDITYEGSGLRWVETEIAVRLIRAMKDKRDPEMTLTQEQQNTLNKYKTTDLVKFVDFVIGE